MASINIDGLQLYHVTLSKPSIITSVIAGRFTSINDQQFVCTRGSWLQIYSIDSEDGKLDCMLSQNTFSTVRCIEKLYLNQSSRDCIIVTADTGQICVLSYNEKTKRLERVILETFGKSGIRRTIPGEYLAVDPKGRAAMTASTEKNKIVYSFSRDSENNITISSPLEANSSRIIVFDICALDTGLDNPLFASLEVYSPEKSFNGSDIETKRLSFYEMDIGLNHILLRSTVSVNKHASRLIPLPGMDAGPSGLLVCSPGEIVYYPVECNKNIVINLPKRVTQVNFLPSVICHTVYQLKKSFFVLVQTDTGDLFKITFSSGSEDFLAHISYFDTLPIAVDMCIASSGYLFLCSQFSNHSVYQVESLGEESTYKWSSNDLTTERKYSPQELKNLVLIDSLSNIAPLVDTEIVKAGKEDVPKIYSICGKEKDSSLRILKSGLQVQNIVSSPLPGNPNGIWTTKVSDSEEFDKYIIISFSNATLVLSIDESIEEVSDSGICGTCMTLGIELIGKDSLLQICPTFLQHIMRDKSINTWNSPEGLEIVSCATNQRQLVLGLSNHELVYFELNSEGNFDEFEERLKLDSEISCLGLGAVPEGHLRFPFAAVGCVDKKIRIISLDPENTLKNLSIQIVSASPVSIVLLSSVGYSSSSSVVMNIGLQNGVYVRTDVDSIMGTISNARSRFLGPKPVRLYPILVRKTLSVLAISTRTWFCNSFSTAFQVIPLANLYLDYASNFSLEDYKEAIIGIEANNLNISKIDSISESLEQDSISLKYSPRKLLINSELRLGYIIESEIMKDDISSAKEPPQSNGTEKGDNYWNSCIEIFNLDTKEMIYCSELENSEAAFSVCFCKFSNQDGANFLIVGTTEYADMSFAAAGGYAIKVYRISQEGKTLELVHSTKIDGLCYSLTEFNGRLLAGVGNRLWIYDMGRTQLLRKCELKLSNQITTLHTFENRIVTTDSRDSVSFISYYPDDNLLVKFADDIQSRHVVSSVLLDSETIACGDKFGNLFVLRCPESASKLAAADDSAGQILHSATSIPGPPFRLETICNYYIGDIPTSIHKAKLVVGSQEVLMYSGIMGTIGALIPMRDKEEVVFYQQLERLLRDEEISITGRNHFAYRSYYSPVKSVIDGDLCEEFSNLQLLRQAYISNKIDLEIRDIERKIGDFRNQSVF